MCITSCTIEHSTRKYDSDVFWNALTVVTTKVIDKNDKEKKDILLSAEEEFISDTIDQIYASKEQNEIDNDLLDLDVEAVACDEDENANNVEMALDMIGYSEDETAEAEDTCDENNDDAGDRNLNEEINPIDDNEIQLEIGPTKRRVTIKRHKVNQLCFIDFLEKGKEALTKKNLKVMRYRNDERKNRLSEINEYIYNATFRKKDTEENILHEALDAMKYLV